MAIIYTYGYDSDLQDDDAWIGTNSGNRKTKQFKASAIAEYLNKQGKVSIGGQMNYIFKPSVANSSGSFTSTGNIKPFSSITSLRVHVNDLGRGNVVDFMTYIVGSQLLIAQQNTPSQFGHYVINSYTVTGDPNFYNLALTYIGGNGSLIDQTYYDLVALNIPDGTGSGVDTITTTDSTFISSTPSIPTAGNVTVTSSLSATGTPDNTTYLRGDNTWASVSAGLAGSGTTNYVAKWSATDTLTDSVIYDNGTNVGIGTNSPFHKLEVYDGESSVLQAGASYVSINSEGTSTSPSLIFSGETGTGLYRASADTLAISTAGSERMRITSAGNVGIGTTSPSEKLEVVSQSGNTNIKIYDSSSNSEVGLKLQNDSKTWTLQNWGSGSDSLRILNNVGNTVQLWDENGNVGIGTTSPAYKLEVNGTTRLNGRLTLGGDVNNFIQGSAGDLKLNSISDFNFVRAGNTFVTIKDSGNVGIGTTSPSYRLHIVGGIIGSDATSASNNTPRRIDLLNANTTGMNAYTKYYSNTNVSADFLGQYGYKFEGGIATANKQFQVYVSDAANPRLVVNGSGNVGIGTTSPSEKLHISSGYALVENTGVGSAVIVNRTDGKALNLKAGGGASQFTFDNSGFFAISADSKTNVLSGAGAGNQVFVVTGAGNVGIGTTSPTQKLHVNGSVRIADVIYDSSNSPGTAGQVLSKPTNDTIAWVNRDSITSIPTSITATPGGTLSLASNIDFVYFTWSGGSGTYTLNLPIASTHAYKIIRFVCDSTVSANDKVHIQGSLGDTVDGNLFYTLNKPYNGVQVWSDGSEWIVIQAKAT